MYKSSRKVGICVTEDIIVPSVMLARYRKKRPGKSTTEPSVNTAR